MHTVVGRDAAELDDFAERWGWQNASTIWREAIANPEIDLVDVTTANNLHREMAIAALEAGKHVACEKPLAGQYCRCPADARCGPKIQEKQTYRLVLLSPRAGGDAGVSAGEVPVSWGGSITCADIICRIGPGRMCR